jgi:pterin-4a-carbinolamine dehydratase
MFNATHPHITIPSASGPLYRNIRPSFPKNANKVIAELNALFADQASVTSGTPSTTSGIWRLEATCDTISAFFVLTSRAQVAEMLRRILDAAEELKHHPNISGVESVGGTWLLVVTCGTHWPAGLSVKDPRLARRIGGILGEVLESGKVGEEVVVGMEGLEEWHWRENMGRARVSMDVGVEEEGGDGLRVDEQRYWRLSTVEDVEALVNGEEEEKGVQGNMPTLRGLVL